MGNMSNKILYKEGFLEGMRYCGWLLSDVPNEQLQINDEIEKAIDTTFNQSKYALGNQGIHKLVSDTVLEAKELREQLELMTTKFRNEHSIARFWHTVAIENNLTYDTTVDK
jgi:hypothetical protein